MSAEVQRDEPPGGPDGAEAARNGAEDRRADDRPRLEVSGTQVCASALAAVSAAVVGSFLGVADTIVGAALASVVATLGSAVYSWWIQRTRTRLRQVDVARLKALAAVNRPGGNGTLGARLGTLPLPKLALDGDDRDDADRPPWDRAAAWARARWAALAQHRRGVLAGATLAFVAAMTLVTAVELVGQRPLAGDGSAASTSIGTLLRGGGGDDGDGGDAEDPTTTTVPAPDAAGEAPTATGPGGTAGDGGPATTVGATTSTTSAPAAGGGDGGTGTGATTPATGATTSTTVSPTTTAPDAPSTTAPTAAPSVAPSAAGSG